jgi:hypothetical protein
MHRLRANTPDELHVFTNVLFFPQRAMWVVEDNQDTLQELLTDVSVAIRVFCNARLYSYTCMT